jgi:hypothetical protein
MYIKIMEEKEIREENDLNIPFSAKKEEPAPKPVIREKRKKKMGIPAPAWFGIGCAAVIGAMLIGWHVREKILGEEIVLLDSSVPVFGGYSSGGYLAEDFAPEEQALKLLEKEVSERREKGRSTDDLEKLIRSVSCNFEKASGYSNNENLVYACTYDQQAAENAGIRLSGTMKTYTVSGLPEYAVLDVFSGVSADWVLSGSGLSIGINAPAEYRDMGISYTYSYGGEEYNGETVNIHAEFDQNVLMSYGYVVNEDEITWQLGPMPEAVTEAEMLSEEERNLLIEELRAKLETEVAGCSNRATLSSFTGTYSIVINSIEKASVEKSMLSWLEDTPSFRVTFGLDVSSDFAMSDYAIFSASYTGRIYRMGDGSIRFLTNTVHACEFSGLIGAYSLKENAE